MQNSLQRGGNTSQSRLLKKHITGGGGRAKREQSQATKGYNHNRTKLGSSLKRRHVKEKGRAAVCQIFICVFS